MVRAEPTNTLTAGIDTNYTTTFTLLLELKVMYGRWWIQFECKRVSAEHFAIDYKIDCCDRKSRAACAQSLAPQQQATIEIMHRNLS